MTCQNLEHYIKIIDSHKTESALSEWLLNLGRRSPSFDGIRTSQNFVNGCQSQTWITSHYHGGIWSFSFASDSFFIQALGRIVTDTYSGLNGDQIQQITYQDFKPLAVHLSIQQQRGLQAFINRVHTLTSGATP